MQTIRVAIVDDVPEIREVLNLYVESLSGLELVGEAINGAEALELVARTEPDVVLMDLQMPVLDGIEATVALRESYPKLTIIALTTFVDHYYVTGALRAGVHGYLLKNSSPSQVDTAIRAALEGRTLIDRRALASLVASMNAADYPQGDPWAQLSKDEQTIVKLVCWGKTDQEIADQLDSSLPSMKRQLNSIYNTLGINTRLQILVEAGRYNFPIFD